MTPREVHAVSSTDINPNLAHSVANGYDIAEVAEARGVKASKDSGFGPDVAQTRQPIGKDIGLLDLIHQSSVSV
jgi:hypothetical protein